jgi:hypothetical protein
MQTNSTRFGSSKFETTGILGVSFNASGETVERAMDYASKLA